MRQLSGLSPRPFERRLWERRPRPLRRAWSPAAAPLTDSELIAKTLDGLDVIPPTSSASTATARRDTRRERLDEPER